VAAKPPRRRPIRPAAAVVAAAAAVDPPRGRLNENTRPFPRTGRAAFVCSAIVTCALGAATRACTITAAVQTADGNGSASAAGGWHARPQGRSCARFHRPDAAPSKVIIHNKPRDHNRYAAARAARVAMVRAGCSWFPSGHPGRLQHVREPRAEQTKPCASARASPARTRVAASRGERRPNAATDIEAGRRVSRAAARAGSRGLRGASRR
jgi:hypothetical protein